MRAGHRSRSVTVIGFLVLLASCQVATTEIRSEPATDQPPGQTSPTTASGEGMVLVLGDFGAGTAEQYAVAEAMMRIAQDREVDAFVTTGDNLYVDDLDLAWRRPYGWLGDRGIPVWAAFGNHDVESEERRQNAESLFGVDHYRSYPWGPVRFLFLDANHPEDPAQLEWLDAQLDGAAGETLVAVFHQPAVSCSEHGPTPLVVDLWMGRFEAADVDLVLQGHDHNYQHHLVEGIDYVVTGGGGKGLYELEPCADGSSPLAAAVEHHFLVLEQAEGLISVSAIRPDGSVIDRFDVNP